MQCATCGTEVIEGQRFCRSCGAGIAPDAVPPPAAVQTDVRTGVTTGVTTDSDSLSPVGKTSRPTKAGTNPVGENSGAQTNLLEQAPGNETRVMDSDALAAVGQTNPSLDATLVEAPLKQQTTPDLQGASGVKAGGAALPAQTGGQLPQAAVTEAMSVSYNTTPPSSRLPQAPPRATANSKGWMVAIGGIALFGAIFLAFLLLGRANRVNRSATQAPPPSRPAPAAEASGETYLSEERAAVDDEETVITERFPLFNNAKFNLSNLSGDITIEGVEGTEAQIRVIKTGGSVEERANLRILYSTLGGNLSLQSPQLPSPKVEIAYEVKLPRSLSQVNIQTVSSKVQVSNIDALVDVKTKSGQTTLAKLVGAVRVETESGDVQIEQASGDIAVTASKSNIELRGVNGKVEVNNTAGDSKAVFDNSTLADSLRFESVSGSIDVRFRADLNADLDADTTSGTIDVQGLGVEVTKSPGFSRAAGRVGIGGRPLKITTVSGNIKVRKS